MSKKLSYRLRLFGFSLLFLFVGLHSFAQIVGIPPKPSPERLVNDLAHMMTAGQEDQLEQKLADFSQQTSNQISIVTIDSLGDDDVSEYATKLGNAWGIGTAAKNNGVLILVSKKDHKINISSGKGLEGALTDIQCGRIIRNEMDPDFKTGDFYEGFSKAADAIIAATKGEYKADAHQAVGRHIPFTAIIILVIIIFFIIKMMGGGGSGGGNYMSRGGLGNFAAGMFLGNMLGGGGRGGDGGGFGGGGDGGGFGGFGGGGFGGGGASGDW